MESVMRERRKREVGKERLSARRESSEHRFGSIHSAQASPSAAVLSHKHEDSGGSTKRVPPSLALATPNTRTTVKLKSVLVASHVPEPIRSPPPHGTFTGSLASPRSPYQRSPTTTMPADVLEAPGGAASSSRPQLEMGRDGLIMMLGSFADTFVSAAPAGLAGSRAGDTAHRSRRLRPLPSILPPARFRADARTCTICLIDQFAAEFVPPPLHALHTSPDLRTVQTASYGE